MHLDDRPAAMRLATSPLSPALLSFALLVCSMNAHAPALAQASDHDDPYLWLEEVTGDKALA
mgnify:CR=1 FL=1